LSWENEDGSKTSFTLGPNKNQLFEYGTLEIMPPGGDPVTGYVRCYGKLYPLNSINKLADQRLKATIDLSPKTKFLSVEGTAKVLGAKFKIAVKETNPQGGNPRELILDIIVTQSGPKKERLEPFGFRKRVEGASYDTVRARFSTGEPDQVADVKVIS
jgi:hypothetical protein